MKKCFLIVIPVLILICICTILKNKFADWGETKIIGNMSSPRVCGDVLIKDNNIHITGGYSPLSSNANKEDIFNLEDEQLKNYMIQNKFYNNYIIVRNKIYNQKTGKEIIVKTKNLYVDNASEIYELDYDMGTPVITIVNKYNAQNPIQILYWSADSFYDATPKLPKEVKSYNLVSAFKLGLYEISFIFTKGNDVYVLSYRGMDDYMHIIKHFKTKCSNTTFAYITDVFHKNILIYAIGGTQEDIYIKCPNDYKPEGKTICNTIEAIKFKRSY